MVTSGQTIIEDYSNGAMSWRFFGGAINLPFVPATVSISCDQQWCSGDYPDEYPCTRKTPEIIDPFTGKKYGAFRSLRPDVAAIHVTMADTAGNGIMIGSEWNRFEMSRAAQKVVLVTDFIVDTGCMRQFPNLTRMISEVVDAVVDRPMSAWPAGSPGVHDSDEEHMFYMNDRLKTVEGTKEYVEKYVLSYKTREEFLKIIGDEKVRKLTNTNTAFPDRSFPQMDQVRRGNQEIGTRGEKGVGPWITRDRNLWESPRAESFGTESWRFSVWD